jgi:GNAT superfamily N-acetyltransferase
VTVVIRALDASDQDWATQFIADRWGANIVIAHGTIYHPHTLPGFVAVDQDERVGLVTYRIEEGRCEIVTLDSTRPWRGIGTALIEAVKESARRAGCKRLWLITTNDNLNALRFYQKRGLALVAVHRHAVDEARRIKPDIPTIGNDGIPLRDEIELEMMLDRAA